MRSVALLEGSALGERRQEYLLSDASAHTGTLFILSGQCHGTLGQPLEEFGSFGRRRRGGTKVPWHDKPARTTLLAT